MQPTLNRSNQTLAGAGCVLGLSSPDDKVVSQQNVERSNSAGSSPEQSEQSPGGRERDRRERPEEARGTGPTTDRPCEARPARPSGAPEARDDRADISGGGGEVPSAGWREVAYALEATEGQSHE